MVGSLYKPDFSLSMNLVMAYFCAATIASGLIIITSFSASHPRRVSSPLHLELSIHKKQTRKLVFVNYSGDPELQKHHGKAIAIDLDDCCAPLPSLFLIHEMRVRAFRPFAPLNPSIPGDSPWQEWIESDGVFDHFSDSFKRDNLPDNSVTVPPRHQVLPAVTNAGGMSSGERLLESLDTDVVAEILTATRAMPSWNDCEEGKSWTGTAEENIQKYLSSIHNTHRASSSCDPL
jgi:hypothetical protein